jgi:hypothetical protein
MEKNRGQAGLELAVLVAIITAFGSALAQNQPGAPPAPQAAVVCRALEVKTAEQMGVTLVLFHQANSSDGPRLAELLKNNDGASVEFETSDGRSHTATVFRLGTCFGRGVLIFPAGSARLARQEQFWLRFPKRANPPASP